MNTILTHPNNTVIAVVRDPQADLSQKLNDLPKGEDSSLHIVKIDNAIFTDLAAAVEDLEVAGITHVDTVVANAATGDTAKSAPISLYISGPWLCYGITKAALNYFIRPIHVQHDWLTAVALQPGSMQTYMGTFTAKCVGMERAPIALENSVKWCLKVINAVSR